MMREDTWVGRLMDQINRDEHPKEEPPADREGQLYMIFRYGHRAIPDVRYVTSPEEVKQTLSDMFFGKGVKPNRRELDGLYDYFTCPTNWWCGVMDPFEGEIDGAIGAVQLRRK